MAHKPGVWSEKALVTVTEEGGSDVAYQAMTSSIRITEGGKDIDQVAFLDGSRGVVKKPAGMIEISFEGYPTDVDVAGGTGVAIHYDSETTRDTVEPFKATATTRRDRYRVAIMWTDDETVSNAVNPALTTKNVMRYVLANAYMTQHDHDYPSGDPLKVSFAFKAPAVDKSKTANRIIESIDGAATTAVLTTLGSYTSTVNW